MARTPQGLLAQFAGGLFSKAVSLGTTASGGLTKLTIRKGDSAITAVTLENEGSATVGGTLSVGSDLTVNGNISYTGKIDRQTVTNTAVADKNIILNSGGTTAGATDVGLQVEGDAGSIIGNLLYSASKWFVGATSTAANEIATIGTSQTLTNKTLTDCLGNTQATTDNSTKLATTAYVKALIAAGGGGTAAYFRDATLSGTQDGTNGTFTIGQTLSAGSLAVWVNGVKMNTADNYTVSGNTLTFVQIGDGQAVPSTTDKVTIMGVY